MPPRFAVYFAPAPGSRLEHFGTRWLGRNAVTGELVEQYPVHGISLDTLSDLTAKPRRYGFHATLKPPFHLAEGKVCADLEQGLQVLASKQTPFAIPGLKLEPIGSFLALVEAGPSPELDALAADCVRTLDGLRAPMGVEERSRRSKPGLTLRQLILLDRFGFPYVLEEFRFHMTLTGRLSGEERECIEQALLPVVAPFVRSPVLVADVCLFEQSAADRPFRLVRRFPFAL